MTERERSEPELDLGEIIRELGHTPESFARVVGRNASGLRRIIRGEHMMARPTARDIIEGLFAEGWQGNPARIWQIRRSPGESLRAAHRRRTALAGQAQEPGTPVSMALANLMQALGRKEVDRVYRSLFGTNPNDKE
jgi:hypothetical protein